MPEEKWWIGVAVEKLSEESRCIYFPNDQRVAAVSNTKCEVIDEEAGGVIGKKVQAPFFQMKLATISCGRVLLLVPSKTTIVADHQISDI